jgi:hypothetical protein
MAEQERKTGGIVGALMIAGWLVVTVSAVAAVLATLEAVPGGGGDPPGVQTWGAIVSAAILGLLLLGFATLIDLATEIRNEVKR